MELINITSKLRGRQYIRLVNCNNKIEFEGMYFDFKDSKYNNLKYRVLDIDCDYDVLVIRIDTYRGVGEVRNSISCLDVVGSINSEYTRVSVENGSGGWRDDVINLYDHHNKLRLANYLVDSISVAENKLTFRIK